MTAKKFHEKLAQVWAEANLFRDVPDEDLDSAIISHIIHTKRDKEPRIFDIEISPKGRIKIKKEWTIDLRYRRKK